MSDPLSSNHGAPFEIELERVNLPAAHYSSKGSFESWDSEKSFSRSGSDPGPYNPHAGSIRQSTLKRLSLQVRGTSNIGDTTAALSALGYAAARRRSLPLSIIADEVEPSEYSIFHREVEDTIGKESPFVKLWLQSHTGLVFQVGLCSTFVLILCYDTVFKKISVEAVKSGKVEPIDNMSFVVACGVASLIIGFSLAFRSGDLHLLVRLKTLSSLFRYMPVGGVFAGTSYLTFMILQLIDGDTFRVLLQARLLGVAVVGRICLGTKQSRAAWACLFLTLLTALAYFQTKDLSGHEFMFEGLLHEQSSTLKLHGYSNATMALLGTDEKTLAILKIIFHAQTPCTLDQGNSTSWAHLLDVQAWTHPHQQKNTGRLLGRLYTFGYVVVDSFNAVYEQKLLQGDKDMPYSIQMILKNVGLTSFALLAKVAIGPYISKPGAADMFKDGFFAGWNNAWAVLTFLMMLLKEWFQGLVVKSLDSLVRQLCGVLSIALLYFLLKLHGVISDPLSLPVIFVNFSVTLSVVAFAVSQASAKQVSALRKQIDDLKGESVDFP